MERGVNYIFIGFCFVASLIGFVVFIFWFGNSGIFKDDVRIYRAYTKQSLDVKIDSPVKYKGINVGKVTNIKFRDNNFEEIEVVIEIRKDLPVKKNSSIKLEQNGFLGGSYLALFQNEKSKEVITTENDAVLKLRLDSLSQILDTIPSIAGKVDYFLDNANEILNENNAKNIANILVSIKDSSNSINDMLKSLNKRTDDLDVILKSVSKITQNTETIIENINNKVAKGEYDLKSILTPTLTSFEKAMNDISTFAQDGSSFINKLENNPYNTIFGYREEK
ncbi:MlaD family protein [Helicobacter sp. MIT 14-3879]|uniref:MlaD family protein n=1 Tax=Helicobacter sp. MIT 14-3879 TaxID=2040649 RepID=UPI000E1E835A|nr:MlaD family protein [Helicobacter sp. MIT 14-3879]RDU62278.1 hypothetical protein CQA44_07230 [Helicobacter sp. MIT 14-3879]